MKVAQRFLLLGVFLFTEPLARGQLGTSFSVDGVVRSSKGAPVAGADCFLFGTGISKQGRGDEMLVSQRVSDEKGRFSVQVKLPGSEPGWGWFGRLVAFTAEGVGIAAVTAESKDKARPDNIQVKPLACGDLNVKLLKPDGKPAAGVEMWVAEMAMLDEGDIKVWLGGSYPRLPGNQWTGTSNENGELTISRVPKSCDVWLKHADARFAQLPGQFDTAVSDPKGDGHVRSFTLTSPGEIKGRVVLPDGVPVAGAVVSMLEHRQSAHYETAYGEHVKTDAQGHYRFSLIPPSPRGYDIRVEMPKPLAEDWVGRDIKEVAVTANNTTALGDWVVVKPAVVTVQAVDAETEEKIGKDEVRYLQPGKHKLQLNRWPIPTGYLEPDFGDAMEVILKEGERRSVQFKLQPIKPEDLITGSVIGLDGKPAAGVSVQLNIKHEWGSPRPEKTGANGSFKLAVPKGADQLTVLAWDADKSMSEPMAAVRKGNTVLKLKESGFGRIEGQVVDEAGKPLRDAAVQLYMEDVSFGIHDGPFHDFQPADEDGRFVFPRYWTTMPSPYVGAKVDGFSDSFTKPIRITPDKTTTVRITMLKPDSGNVLAGVVLDANDQPAAGVRLQLQSGQDFEHAVTDAEGRFSSAPLARSDVFVIARWETDSFTSIKRERMRAPNANLMIKMPAATGEVTGTVTDSTGKPLGDVEVNSMFDRGRKTRTDAEGKFALKGMVDGWLSADVIFCDNTGLKREHRFRVKTGSTDLTLRMPRENRKPMAEVPRLLLGKPAPPLQIQTWLNTPPLKEQAGGKVRILDFWGLECAPCLAAMPKVGDFWKAQMHANLEVIAVSGFYPEAEVKEYLAKHPGFTFPFAIQTGDGTTSQDYDIRAVPTYVVIDQAGIIVSYGHDWNDAKTAASKLLTTP